MNLFIIEKIEDSILCLGEEETHHLSKVLRIKEGQEVFATDGRGTLWKAKVGLITKRTTSLIPISYELNYKKLDFSIHLAVALPKSTERLEWLLEKAVEIGVDEITPILSIRSERKKLNFIRAKKIIQSAVKQSFRAYVPILNEPLSFEKFLINQEKNNKNQQNFIAHCNEDFEKKTFKELLPHFEEKKLEYTLLVGPEGDFTTQEIQKATDFGYRGVNLSKFRLRVETAAMVGLQHVHFLLDK